MDNDDEFDMDGCDGCNQEFYKNDLNECPCSYVEDNKLINLKYCNDCCIRSLEEGFCEGECECDFVEEWKIETFKKIFAGTEYKIKEDMIYTNNSNTLAFGHISKDIKAILKKRERKDFNEIIKYYKGDVIFIINHKGNNISYDIDLFQNAESFFKLARKNNLGWSWQYFTDGKILLIEGENMWCLLSPSENGYNFGQEEEKFNERILKGLDFFKIKITNQLDWSIIKPDEFEDLCYDLLKRIKRFENVKKIGGGTGELCRDISLIEKYETLTGIERRKWVVQCKHILSRNVNQDDMPNITNVLSAHDSDGIFIITSNRLSSGVKRTLQALNDDDTRRDKATWWEKNDLVNHLEKHQDLIKKYFFKKWNFYN